MRDDASEASRRAGGMLPGSDQMPLSADALQPPTAAIGSEPGVADAAGENGAAEDAAPQLQLTSEDEEPPPPPPIPAVARPAAPAGGSRPAGAWAAFGNWEPAAPPPPPPAAAGGMDEEARRLKDESARARAHAMQAVRAVE